MLATPWRRRDQPRVWRWAALAAASLSLSAASPSAAAPQCDAPQAQCAAVLDQACLSRVGAGALAALPPAGGEDACADQFTQYRSCLADIMERCGDDRPGDAGGGAVCSPEIEQQLWATVRDSDDVDELAIFVETCPASPFARIAERRIAKQSGAELSGAADDAPKPDGAALSAADRRAGQAELRRLGLYRGRIDGDWGRGSISAMRAFQRQAGLPEDGALTLAALDQLKAAPTPPQQAAPPRIAGYSGLYVGTWRSPSFGTSGRSEFRPSRFDPTTGAITGRMVIVFNGVRYQGEVRGALTPSAGGQASGEIRAPDGSGWRTQLIYNPGTDYETVSGAFTSVPLPGTFGFTVNGTFVTRLTR